MGLRPDGPVALRGFLCDQLAVVGKEHLGVAVPELECGLVGRRMHRQVIACEAVPHDIGLPLDLRELEQPGKAFTLVRQRQITPKGEPLLEVV